MSAPKVRTDEIVRAQAGQFNSKTGERHYRNEVEFSFYNHREIMDALESGRAVDLAQVPKQKDKNALILGSGPTLDAALPLMKDWEGDIICSTSHASTLLAHGRVPEHIIALDPDCHINELKADTWEGRNSILHLHPGVTPDLVRGWKGRMAVFRKLQPQIGFYGHEQAMGYSPLGEFRDGRYHCNEAPLGVTAQIPMLACALAAQISLAKILGYRQLALVGADFSFPGEKHRFSSQRWEDGQWVTHHPVSVANLVETQEPGCVDPVVETEFDGLLSTPMQIFYMHQAVIAWRITEKDIVNTSDKGLLRMLPYVPLEDVIRRGNKGVKGFNYKQICRVSEEHLAKQNIYFLYVGAGVMPQEFKDPLHEIPNALKQIKATLTAQGKGDDLDLEANMKRINRLFKKVADAS